jgi:aryl carrier-like protein
VQRAVLTAHHSPADDAEAIDDSGATGEPDDEVERRVAAIAADVIGVTELDRRGSFLECGGDSVRLLQFVARLRDLFGVELTLVEVFDAPSLQTVARVVTDRVLEQIGSAAAGSAA